MADPPGVRLAVLVGLVTLLLASPAVALTVPMERQEVIQRSGTIFVGVVLDKAARWNAQGNMIVTDYTFQVDEGLYGNVGALLVLTFAGGVLPNEGQRVSDVPEFQVGDLALLMLEDSAHPLLSPITGMHQGKFVAESINPNTLVRDGTHQLVMSAQTGTTMTFREFVEQVRREIPIAKSQPLPSRSVPAHLQTLVLPALPSKTYDASRQASVGAIIAVPIGTGGSFALTGSASGGERREPSQERASLVEPGERGEAWSYSHRAKNVPIVFDPLPGGGLLGNHDQFQMTYWNQYADIFRVFSPASPTWAWGNGKYDIAGFVDNATMIAQFGSGWGASTLAVCWLRWDSTGFSIESDIAMNPAFSWTTDNNAAYGSSNLWPVDQTLLHEVGHSWGLEHNFNALSAMNYFPKKYRSYNALFVEDTMAVRSAFPGQAVSRRDVGVFLYYSSGFQNVTAASLSSQTMIAGSSFTVGNYVIENAGTIAVAPTIDFYLTPAINNWAGARYIGSASYSSLATNSYYFPTSANLTIPSSTPAGTYYLAAWVNTSGDSIANNNPSWLDRLITVQGPPPATTLIAPSGTVSDTTPTYSWSNVASATWYYLWVNGPAGTVIQQWHSAASVCSGGTCSATPSTALASGSHIFWVQTWNPAGYGAWSSGLGFLVSSAQPPRATLIAPSGTVSDTTPTYSWSNVASATWYYLWVNGPSGNVIQQWYSAASVCSGGTCSATPSTTLANGGHTFWVQTWNPSGYGPWSLGLNFNVVSALPPTPLGPSGTVTDTTPTYSWTSVATATWYYLWVNGPSGNVIQQWYLASSICSGGTCSVTPSTILAFGGHTFWVQAWDPIGGYGPWSAGRNFTVSLFP